MKTENPLIGKTVTIMTDAKVPVELIIKSVKEMPHSRELEPATPKNDWWPQTQDWTTVQVTFTNGFVKEYRSLSDIPVKKEDVKSELINPLIEKWEGKHVSMINECIEKNEFTAAYRKQAQNILEFIQDLKSLK